MGKEKSHQKGRTKRFSFGIMNIRNEFACLSFELNTHIILEFKAAPLSSFSFEAFLSCSFLSSSCLSTTIHSEERWIVIRWKSLFTIMKSRLTIDEPKVQQEVLSKERRKKIAQTTLCFPGNDCFQVALKRIYFALSFYFSLRKLFVFKMCTWIVNFNNPRPERTITNEKVGIMAWYRFVEKTAKKKMGRNSENVMRNYERNELVYGLWWWKV